MSRSAIAKKALDHSPLGAGIAARCANSSEHAAAPGRRSNHRRGRQVGTDPLHRVRNERVLLADGSDVMSRVGLMPTIPTDRLSHTMIVAEVLICNRVTSSFKLRGGGHQAHLTDLGR